jgi:hypothetical protein
MKYLSPLTGGWAKTLGHFLGIGRKLNHTGKALWLGCMSGDPKSWKKMRRYNQQDVRLLEAVYPGEKLIALFISQQRIGRAQAQA